MSYYSSINKIQIPPYNKKQEFFNSVSHLLGIPLGFYVFISALVKYLSGTISLSSFWSLLVFALTVLLVYSFSTIYHNINSRTLSKKIFRVIDHAVIFLLIAGTYTPICFYLIEQGFSIGMVMLVIEWASAIVGILLNVFLFKNSFVQIFSLFLYVIMGWLVMFCGGFIFLQNISFILILVGGIIYTIGAISYAIGHKNLNFHCLFHIFVLLSTIIQMIGVLMLFQ